MILSTSKLLAILTKGSAAVVSLAFNLIAVFLYEPEKSADVLLLITILLISSVVFRLGSDQFIVRLISRRGRLTSTAVRIISSFQFVIITIVIITLSVLTALKIFGLDFTYLNWVMLMLSVGFYSLTQINSFCLQALKKPVAFTFFLNLGLFLVLCILHLIIYFLKSDSDGWTVEDFLYILIISTLINYLLSCKVLKERLFDFSNLSRMIRIYKINLNYYYFSVLQVFMVWLPQIVLYLSLFKEDVASFTFLHRVSLLISFGLISISSVYTPIIARNLKEKKYENVERDSSKFIKFSIAFGGVFTISLGVYIYDVVTLLGKTDLVDSRTMWVLFIGQIINILTGPCLQILIMGGNISLVQKLQLRIAIIFSLIGIPLTLIFGMFGAALFSTSILISSNLIYAYFTFKIYKINVYKYLL